MDHEGIYQGPYYGGKEQNVAYIDQTCPCDRQIQWTCRWALHPYQKKPAAIIGPAATTKTSLWSGFSKPFSNRARMKRSLVRANTNSATMFSNAHSLERKTSKSVATIRKRNPLMYAEMRQMYILIGDRNVNFIGYMIAHTRTCLPIKPLSSFDFREQLSVPHLAYKCLAFRAR